MNEMIIQQFFLLHKYMYYIFFKTRTIETQRIINNINILYRISIYIAIINN